MPEGVESRIWEALVTMHSFIDRFSLGVFGRFHKNGI